MPMGKSTRIGIMIYFKVIAEWWKSIQNWEWDNQNNLEGGRKQVRDRPGTEENKMSKDDGKIAMERNGSRQQDFFFFNLLIDWLCGCMQASCGSWFSSSTIWVPEMKLRSPAWPFTHWAIWPAYDKKISIKLLSSSLHQQQSLKRREEGVRQEETGPGNKWIILT